ncbi:MAG: type III-B CRISPR-associated protein Cas10/Cmr2 [Syntrophaceae bacterium]|nr:type III-B CRISPR-associated protein Cas10/Cmr2 [Syntrophaceae bacterium]
MSILLAISIGPVQEFIAAARRTRDLWFGSWMLSEISRTAASTVQNDGNMIFPTAQDITQNTVVANIILAELPLNIVPSDVANKTREAIEQKWRTFAKEAREVVIKASSGTPILREDLWSSQLNDALEFYAAWTPIYADQYGQARTRVMRLLAGRKACRNFLPAQGQQGVPKSSLDGRRESVLQEHIPPQVRTNLRLNKGEQLCAVGLTKRLAGDRRSYPSVSRIAADPWLRKVDQLAQKDDKIREAFERLKHICSDFNKKNCLYALDPSQFPQFKHFPYEGTCLFPSRFEDWKKETNLTDKDLEPLLTILADLKSLNLGEPDPYLAILAADGDHIGRLLSQIKKPDEHRKFSRTLALFSMDVYKTVEKYNGICIFAGGDDVLAFVPTDQCLPCARNLRDKFSTLSKVVENSHSPTLSVGIAIGHCMEPLEDLRRYGLKAEEAAKDPTLEKQKTSRFAERNGLAIRAYPRSGVDIGVREQWQDNDNSLDIRLKYWADRFRKRELPRKLPYDLRIIARDLSVWPSPGAPPEAVEAEIDVLLKRKQVRKDLRKVLEDKLKTCDSAAALLRLAEEMLVSQWISDAQQDLNNNQEGDQ